MTQLETLPRNNRDVPRVLPRGVGVPARPGLPQGVRARGPGRALGAVLPGLPRRPRQEDKDRQRPGARQPRDQASHRRRPVLPVQGVAAQARRLRARGGEHVLEENMYWRKNRVFSEDSIASVESFVAPGPTELELANAQAKAMGILEKAVERAKA